MTALVRKRAQPPHFRKLPAETVAKLAGHATRIRTALQRSLTEVGAELTAAKALLNHGQFTKWVAAECGITPRTAQLVLGAYRLCLKNEKFSLLGRSALFILGAADVPASTITAVERQITAGDVPRYTDVAHLVRKARGDRPSPVSLAVAMQHEPSKATVVDLNVHRVLATIRTGEAELDREGLQKFRDEVKVADIAVMLSGILDSGQVHRLVTMIRNVASGAVLATLADALEAI